MADMPRLLRGPSTAATQTRLGARTHPRVLAGVSPSSPQPHEQLLAAVFESAIDGVLVIDERGVIQLANAAAGDLFGYPEEQLIGRNVSILMNRDHAARHDGYLERYLRTGEARIIGIGREVEGRRRDGSSFPFRLSVGEITLPDRTLFSGIVHDRSAEHAYQRELAELARSLEEKVAARTRELEGAREDALRALERERELGEMKSRFVSLASHEFRTPLSTILSSAELLRRYTETAQQARRERHIERIRNTVVHLTDLLNDFLSLGRMDEGRVAPQVGPVNLPALVAEFGEYIAPVLKTDQRVELTGAEAVGMVYTDSRMLRNVLNNLVSNASKYSPLGAVLRVRFSRLGSEADGASSRFRVEVADDGIGIPPSEQAQLFGRFFRASNAEHTQGTGLGLHIVRRYVELLGGTIGFASELGRGSTFTVELPDRASPPGA